MFKSIAIDGFRGFKDFHADGFTKLNLITGMNGTGKTALLEAIQLVSGPEYISEIPKMHARRGAPIPGSDKECSGAIEDLFSDNNFSFSINSIYCVNNNDCGIHNIGTLTSFSQFNNSYDPILITRQAPVFRLTHKRINVENLNQDGYQDLIAYIKLNGKDIFYPENCNAEFKWSSNIKDGSKIDYIDAYSNKLDLSVGWKANNMERQILISPIRVNFNFGWTQQGYRYYHDFITDAYIKRSKAQIINTVRLVEGRITDIMPLMVDGERKIFIDIGGDKLVPATSMGRGFLNVLNLAVTLADLDDGVLLIDEIEDGVHYSVFPSLMKLLVGAVAERNIQVFITTHSADVIRALEQEMARSDFTDAAILTLNRDDDGKIFMVGFDDVDIHNAASAALDLR